MITLRVLQFSMKSCTHCEAMERKQTLQKLKAKHPNLVIVKVEIADAEGNVPPGTIFEKNHDIAEEYGVENLPTMVFEAKSGDEGLELFRVEGEATFKQFDKMLVEALEVQSPDAGRSLPWS